MTSREARNLVAGTRVLWRKNASDVGVVVNTTALNAVTVKWDNGDTGTIHYDDCGPLSVAPIDQEPRP